MRRSRPETRLTNNLSKVPSMMWIGGLIGGLLENG